MSQTVSPRSPRKKTLLALALSVIAPAAAAQLPDIKPGDTCDKLRAAYGKESSLEGPAHTWKLSSFTLQVLVRPNGPCVAGSVNFIVDPGSTLHTRDGILLGRDTIAQAALKLKGRIDDTSYVYIRGEGKAYGQIVVPPNAAFPYKETYSWQLNPAAYARLSTTPTRPDFTTESVNYFTIDPPDPQGAQ